MAATWPLTHNRRPWTEVQDDVLREAYGKVPVERIAKVLGRTVSATVVHARELGLTKGCRVWTDDEIDRLADLIEPEERTCYVEHIDDDSFHLSCGHEAAGHVSPSFCPYCGAKVVEQ